MIVIVPKTSGFCPGVKRAEDGVFKIKETSNKVNLHGPLIHNQNYISMLQQHNISSVAIDSLSQGDTLVIRTHGISRHEEKTLADKFVLKDLTCPIVKRVQKNVEKAANDNSFVIISGKADHAEVQGLVSYAQCFLVIESKIELDLFIKDYHKVIPKECQRIFIISQTTHSREFFEELCTTIQQNISHLPITVKDTICSITENKEQESIQLQKDVDFTIVIGDPTSSNSKKLYAILKKASKNTIFIQNLIHLQQQGMSWNNINKVLVVSSTSTPLFIEKEIVDYLEKI
ncbi:MAG: 4-hydroxy-3-methylbut-2-enyl diphosphate reductase [Spirochaetota bacterium]|nr:4-hydroxy-3-methylbut-2-enyl diphosphate reductase [Spirochaetota bacterium]